ncbi:MAG: chemotaxis protein CheX [Geobacteraceae bacterium]|nr:chemotaxis protein CheX [Geobacteraceae bacterium]
MEELQHLLGEKLSGVVDETFETMAFINTEEVDEDQLPVNEEQLREARLLVTSPIVMEIHLHLAEELLHQIVETMYTIDEEDITDEQIVDVLAETLNTLAGRLMTELLPPDQAFSLSLPEIVPNDHTPLDENIVFSAFYLADDLPVSIKISAAALEELEGLLKH